MPLPRDEQDYVAMGLYWTAAKSMKSRLAILTSLTGTPPSTTGISSPTTSASQWSLSPQACWLLHGRIIRNDKTSNLHRQVWTSKRYLRAVVGRVFLYG